MVPVGAAPATRAPSCGPAQLVLAHGWNATAYQILNPGFRHWFSRRGDAVARAGPAAPRLGGRRRRSSLERLAEVVAEFESDAAAAGHGVCYFGAAGASTSCFPIGGGTPRSYWGSAGLEPGGLVRHHRTARLAAGAVHRVRNKGVTVAERPASCAPATRACNAAWPSGSPTRGLPPMHSWWNRRRWPG